MDETTDNAAERQENDDREENVEQVSALDVISLESLVSVLIKKGVCTADELFAEEQNRRLYMDTAKDISLLHTKGRSDAGTDGSHRKRKQGWLKRRMSKRRWTRRVGTAVFGWHWKKTKNSPRTVHIEDLKK